VFHTMRGFYESSFLRQASRQMLTHPFPEVMEHWHAIRSAATVRHSDGVVFSVLHGNAVVIAKRCTLSLRGRERRRCTVIQLARVVDTPPPRLELRRLVDESDPHMHRFELDLGDCWAVIAYTGPILPHPDEQCHISLRLGGSAFISGDAPIGGHAIHMHTSWPVSWHTPMDTNLLQSSFAFDTVRELERLWITRVRFIDGDPLDVPFHYTGDARRAALRQTDQLRLFALIPEQRPSATLNPDQALTRALILLNNDGFSRDGKEWTPLMQPSDGLSFTVDVAHHLSATYVPIGPADPPIAPKYVWFIPLRAVPRVLIYADTGTFFYIDRNPRLRRARGLPPDLFVGGVSFSANKDATPLIMHRLGHARSMAEIGQVLCDVFNTNGDPPVMAIPLSKLGSPVPVPMSPMSIAGQTPDDEQEDEMDLDTPRPSVDEGDTV
jgi:hypothetical protein